MKDARVRGGSINIATARELRKALDRFAAELSAMIRNLPPDAEVAARLSIENIRQLAADLERRMRDAIERGVDLSFSDTLRIWQDAQQRVAHAADVVPNALLGAVRSAELTTAQAFAGGRFSYSWRSLLRGQLVNAAEETASIVQDALLRGESPDTLARQIEPFVTGRERFPDGLPEAEKPNAAAAFSVEHNAQRIAFSETHNARREAEIQHFTADPHIALGRWTLSPNRGTQRQPDVCDALAKLDWYGLGSGVFFLSRVPVSPHPWDRCELMPVTFTRAIAGLMAKANGQLAIDIATVVLPGQGELTPRAVERIRQRLGEIINTEPVAIKPIAPRAA